MAGDTFQKLGDFMSRAIAKLSVKTASSLEKSKIKMHIESLTKDVQELLLEVGAEAYTLWLNQEPFILPLAEKLAIIKKKKSEIEQLSIELASIDDRDNEILGATAGGEQKEEVVVPQKPCCPNCGSERDPIAKFCRKCGHKLQ